MNESSFKEIAIKEMEMEFSLFFLSLSLRTVQRFPASETKMFGNEEMGNFLLFTSFALIKLIIYTTPPFPPQNIIYFP